MYSKITKTIVTCLGIFCFLPSTTFACSCVWGGKFSQIAKKSEVVVHARIKNFGSRLSHGETLHENMVVEVIDVIKGSYQGTSLKLLGDPGHLCRAYVDTSRFKIGDEHLFALRNEESTQPLVGCGESAILIEHDLAVGYELGESEFKQYTIPLENLRIDIELE